MASSDGPDKQALQDQPAADILSALRHWARRAPEAPALLTSDAVLTFGDLMREVDGAAQRLRAAGVVPGDAVGLIGDPSASTAIAALAVWHCAASLIPAPRTDLAAACPPVRLMLGAATEWERADLPAPWHSVPRLTLTATGALTAETSTAVSLDAAPISPGATALTLHLPDPAGMHPRLVSIGHADLFHSVSEASTLALSAQDVALWTMPLSTAAGVVELFAPLAAGAAIVPFDLTVASPALLPATIARHCVTVVGDAAAFDGMEVSGDAGQTVRLAMLRADDSFASRRDMVQQRFPGSKVVTVQTSLDPIMPSEDGAIVVPLTETQAAKPAPSRAVIRSALAAIWDDLLGCGRPSDDMTFFSAGGTSLLLVRAQARLQTELGVTLEATRLFETPRFGDLVTYLADLLGAADEDAVAPHAQPKAPTDPKPVPAQPEDSVANGDIAIIGYAARVPGAATLAEFWQHQLDGSNLIHRFDAQTLEDDPASMRRQHPAYVPARGILDDVEMFDAKFFGIMPKEAQVMDPQARLFLEMCVEALDHGAVDPMRDGAGIGVFGGMTASTYLLQNLMSDRAVLDDFVGGFQIDNYHMITGTSTDTLATRVAFKLNLKGPALTVNTTCSTSLTAIAQAVMALRSGQCKAALAGGISVTFPQRRGYVSQEGGMASADGLCRPFDAQAGGTVFGHGGGVVLLKPLARALADGDRIEGVIKGVGLNNDGADKVAFTAPSVQGQAAAIRAAYADAAISPASLSYIECHGTATPLGDPIEIRGLTEALGLARGEAEIALGSIKGNIGHLDAGAGVVGVIRTLQMMAHRTIPAVANFTAPNPQIGFAAGPFHVAAETRDWTSDGPRRAGVSSFGVGGTNVHLVLEEPPTLISKGDAADPVQILPLSAKSPDALGQMVDALAEALSGDAPPPLGDVARSLQDGRSTHPFRLVVAAETPRAAADALRVAKLPKQAATAEPPVVFLFPGQGAQYPGMGQGLYAGDPTSAEWIDRGAAYLAPILGEDLRDLLLHAEADDPAASARLAETRLTQPALFLTQVAAAQSWIAKGLRPDALIGHSVGEYAAAVIAEVMSFETGLTLMAERGRLMQAQPRGAMLSVRATLDRLEPLMIGAVDLAAANAPQMQVIAGPEAAIADMEARLEAAGVPARRLHTSHAFHSRMMAPVVDGLRRALTGLRLSPPKRPIISTVTGALMGADATDPLYWAEQARAPVQFAKALAAVADAAPPVLVEAGAGKTLCTFAAQILKPEARTALVQTLPDHQRERADLEMRAHAAGQLWAAGVPLDWPKITRPGARKAALPGTVFLRKRHWVDPPAARAVPATPAPVADAQPSVMMDVPPMTQMPQSAPRKDRLIAELATLLTDLSGDDITAAEAEVSFLELGFDSLFMGQVAQALSLDYGVEMTFRSLLSDHPSLDALAAHMDAVMPADPAPTNAPPPTAVPASVDPAPQVVAFPQSAPRPEPVPAPAAAPLLGGDAASVMQAQMQTMQQVFAAQLQALGSTAPQAAMGASTHPTLVSAPQADMAPSTAKPTAIAPTAPKEKPVFRVGRAPALGPAEFTAAQVAFAQDAAARYSAKYPSSKSHIQAYRAVHADPRTAAGFREEWKELSFPIVATRAKGAYIEDADGNCLVDMVSGFGQNAFGHAPDFVQQALAKQMEKGYAIGPQSDAAGPVAERFAKMVGHERVTFCNTGSEAVMAAMRLARAVTGRDKIVVFSNDYHGQFDEVLVKGKARSTAPGALPIAPGIPRDTVSNMVVLPYGEDATLDWLRAHGSDVAAVVVEPVQSRNPEHRPIAFVRALRDLTRAAGSALVMDEVVSGFRTHPRGVQGLWEIEADLATYGKVVGGGMPIGMLAGTRRFMDALDGGYWSFGDDSIPQVAPTFFAGTFVRHPLVVAAVDAVLDFLERDGDRLWTDTAAHAESLARDMNTALAVRGLPDLVKQFSSWIVIKVSQHDPRAALLYPLMREQGVHILDGFPMYLTTEHGAAECVQVLAAFEAALDQLQSVDILPPEQAVARPARHSDNRPVPLTESQREIWMTHQLGDLPAASFNESTSLRIAGPLDRVALHCALNQVIARHDALRTTFAADGATFTVDAERQVDLVTRDVSDAADPEVALAEILAVDAKTPVDIVGGVPFRAVLVALAPDAHVLVMTAHHIVCDGWSYNTVFDDLSALYTAAVAGKEADLAPAPSFADYARSRKDPAPADDVLAYWRGQYADIPPLPELPSDRPRGAVRSYAGDTLVGRLDADLVKAVRKAGAKQGCTLFSTLFAGLQVMLGRLSGSGQVVLGVPTGGQANLPNPNMVGHLVNFLPIRADFDLEDSAAVHLTRVRDAVMTAFDHGEITFGTMVRALEVPRTLARLPLTEVQFNLERVPEALSFGDATAQVSTNPKAAVNFDLFFNMVEEAAGSVRIDVDYNTSLYDAATVQRWIAHLTAVLAGMAADVETSLAALPMLSPEAEADLANRWNQSGRAYDKTLMMHDLVLRQAVETPDATALIDESGRWTYAELAAASDAMAAQIQSVLPDPGQRIGVALPRGKAMVAALIAVLRAGHAYVPVDIGQPRARQQEILAAGQVAAVLCGPDNAPDLARGDILGIDPADASTGATPAPTGQTSAAPAYVIFTSGSTGTPKGVVIPHRAAVNFLLSMAEAPGATASDKMLAMTTICFDIAVLELFLPLAVGGTVEVAGRTQVLDVFAMVARLNAGDITMVQATPTYWSMLVEAGFEPAASLKMLAGGEPIAADLAAKLTATGAALWNMYGPTETTIWSSLARLEHGGEITIGAPVANTDLHVLDGADRLCPPGVIGELNIGGDGLALGYFKRPDLTDAAFRDVVIAGQSQRLYRTGDLALRRADGALIVLGRRDGQVKLRGYRIELGEIETRLRAAPAVAAAAVDLRPGPANADQLVAYVVAREGQTLATRTLAERLAAEVPDYMVPTAWVEMEALPQTANGKLDRKRLPRPDAAAPIPLFRETVAAATEMETKLLALWSKVLNRTDLSVTDTIFALGIDSLAVFRLAAAMLADGLQIEARHILEHPSIRALATFAETQADAAETPARPSLSDFLRSRTGT